MRGKGTAMISLMIVDDEELILKGIRSIIKRENHGYLLVGEAESGQEAIDLAKQLEPELIITDICMPGISGLQMIKEIKHALPMTKFIVLSGHGEFQFAQEAVRLGVIDYLLKPISSKGLYEVLEKVKAQYLEEVDKREQEEMVLLEQSFAMYMFNKDYRSFEFLKDVIEKEQDFMVEILTIRKETALQGYVDEVKEWVRKYIENGKYGVVLYKENKIIIVIYMREDTKIQYINTAIIDRLEEIFLCEVLINSAASKGKISEIPEMYHQAELAEKMRFYETEKKKVAIWDGADVISFPIDLMNEENAKQMFRFIELGDKLKYQDKMKELLEEVKERHVNPYDLTRYVQGVIRICISQLQFKGYLEHAEEHVLDEYIHSVNSCAHINELTKKLEYIYDEITRILNHQSSALASRTILEVKKYIQENYHKEIGLNDAAEVVFLNPKYLSDLFRKETGQTFSNYLTKVKMEKAKKLLQKNDLKIYEVGESVGYRNSKNFAKVFKKYSGVTPQEYRKLI